MKVVHPESGTDSVPPSAFLLSRTSMRAGSEQHSTQSSGLLKELERHRRGK
jgi:hypothetical protein